MRYCSNCGNPVSDDAQKFCLKCGTELQTSSSIYESANQSGECGYSNVSSDSVPLKNEYPMKWFKFLIYFALFFGALIEFVYGMNYIMGTIYLSQTGGQVTAEMVYAMYGTPLKIWDVLYGLIMLATAVFSIITRFKLAKFKQNGPKFLYILYIAGAALALVYNIGVALITDVEGIFNVPYIISIIFTGIVVFANYKYFSKRDKLFCN